jgi:hypothetical protein
MRICMVNTDHLNEIAANKGKCLCRRDTRCPCKEFLSGEKCTCRVYFDVESEGDKAVLKQLFKEAVLRDIKE